MESLYQEQLKDSRLMGTLNFIDKWKTQLGRTSDIQLPGIVVIGDQSTGKSSVLEAISGVELPRGTGTVTRCPVELRLRQASQQRDGSKAFLATITAPGFKKATAQASEVGKHISEAMTLLTGQGFSDKPIIVEIQQPEGVNLTLIDLPGLIQNDPVNLPGTKLRIQKMVSTYLQGDQNVICCVLDAHTDFINQGAISLAKQFDPDGHRTLAAITKIDCANHHTIAKHISDLNLDFVLVRCRNQDEILAKVTAVAARQREKEFFAGEGTLSDKERAVSDLFGDLAYADKRGVVSLVRKLCEVQRSKLHGALERIEKQVIARLKVCEGDLGKLPKMQDHDGALTHIFQVSQEMNDSFRKLVEGAYSAADHPDKHVAARLQDMNTEFPLKLWEAIDGERPSRPGSLFTSTNFVPKAQRALLDAPMTLPHKINEIPAFKSLYESEVHAKLMEPCKRLVKDVEIYLFSVIWDHLVQQVAPQQRRLQERLLELVKTFLEGQRERALAYLETLVRHQKRVFTSNSRYQAIEDKGLFELRSRVQQKEHIMRESNGNEAERQRRLKDLEAQKCNWDFVVSDHPSIKDLGKQWVEAMQQQQQPHNEEALKLRRRVLKLQFEMALYTAFVIDRVSDMASMAVADFLVDEPLERLPRFVMESFLRSKDAQDLINDPAVVQRRTKLQEEIASLQAALTDLKTLPQH